MVKYAPRKVYIRESGGYVELSYTEFCRCRESDQTYMDKLFIPIQGCLLEVVREQYTDFYRDKERWRYLQKLDTKNRLLSLDGFTDSEGNPLDFITDEAVDIAETVVNAVMVDRLKAALSKLTAEYGKIGGNLNQIARSLNEYGSPYRGLEKEVRGAAADLAALKFEVLQKVGEAVGDTQTYQL